MAKFAKVTPIAAKREVFADPAAVTGLFTALASNGASTPAYGAYFEVDDLGCKYAIVAENAAANGDDLTVTVKAGNSFQSLGADLSRTDLGYGEYTVLTTDSGRSVFTETDAAIKELTSATAADQIDPKGKIIITGTSANVKVLVIKLP